MTRHAARRFADSLLVLSMFLLAACGSGGVSGPAVTTGALAITPASAVVYSDAPVKFVITGGTAPYFITSSNGAALPVPAGAFNYNELTLIPGTVGADTSVTLTATDAKNSTSVSSAVTVRPRTISNVVTITPSPNQPAGCGTSLCAGGDAEVSVVLTQAGLPLAGRTVRFDVVSGDLRIITSPPGTAETLSLSGTAVTDATGTARVRVRALTDVGPETALLLVTDVSSGFTQSVSVPIAASSTSGTPLTVQPAKIQFTGPDSNTCASGVSADVLVIGGRPPYQVTQPPGFLVNPLVLANSGGRVTVTSTGQCARSSANSATDGGQTMAIVDAAGASATVVIHNDPAPVSSTPVPTFGVAPDDVTLDSCSASANVALVGGTGSYFGVGTNAISVSTFGNQGAIQRRPATATTTATTTVAFSDGQSTKQVTVHLTGTALGACP